MVTLTLIHKGHVQGTYQFASGVITLGSDASSDIVITAADVASFHASIQLDLNTSVLRHVGGTAPVTLNGRPAREHVLRDGDRIGIGDYVLFYVEEPEQNSTPTVAQNQDSEAFLQYLSGSSIGRVLPLRNALTQLGKPGQNGAAVIAKRQNGYFFSALDQDQFVKINRQSVGNNTTQLNHGDILDIGTQQLQFFRES